MAYHIIKNKKIPSSSMSPQLISDEMFCAREFEGVAQTSVYVHKVHNKL